MQQNINKPIHKNAALAAVRTINIFIYCPHFRKVYKLFENKALLLIRVTAGSWVCSARVRATPVTISLNIVPGARTPRTSCERYKS